MTSSFLSVRLSADDRSHLRAIAEARGVTLSTLVRELLLERAPRRPPRVRRRFVPELNRLAYSELARLAGNINRLARLANSGQRVLVDDALLLAVADEVRRLRLALLGVREEGAEGDRQDR